ncbi:hypothetical protein HDIA_0754 [Hartmannibacter diazotrophicus]|uniref:Uncharacterized protein n=1 Tax=Hartmannibacter diazotrophicus TaxID=1482074 RepID=A0A2C9D481_9HYPH|nr:hypothetical protein [Hartmannibacter diazotrophicus]SON54295.1 hypothetical protein HDIA_0754 [Hartmannibacter diazotrophicus]
MTEQQFRFAVVGLLAVIVVGVGAFAWRVHSDDRAIARVANDAAVLAEHCRIMRATGRDC